ncbi:MAG TPA: SpoIIE family protein phosphatase, partial [bacterium]|nr:SpoIIE family protein phosphatase [bacterium]
MATFFEVGSHQEQKRAQRVSGDFFLSARAPEPGRIVAVLSDGLGSGIKARVLSALTATMARRFVTDDNHLLRSVEAIMRTLPVCRERKISYATFTILDLRRDGQAKLIEFDNPPAMLLRGGCALPLPPPAETLTVAGPERRTLRVTAFTAQREDRIILCSDGVTQAGMGGAATPLGWGADRVQAFAAQAVADRPDLSARALARLVTGEAKRHDRMQCRDDITCGVVYLREPRELLVVSGPPITPDRDRELAAMTERFTGTKVVCGGTTAAILARELQRTVTVDLRRLDPEVPPCGAMPGFALVTEGILTLARACELLETGGRDAGRVNGATQLVAQLLDSDRVHFVVGTRINDRHYDPSVPADLEI